MALSGQDIEILLAPSILGLRPDGTELLGKALLTAGLAEQLGVQLPVVDVPVLNHLYSDKRDAHTQCLNVNALQDFSFTLSNAVSNTLSRRHFACVLGGDCSILLGIMSGLKKMGRYGLIFLDAHADFYEPEKSTTGEVADMDLAIVTGRGPAALTDLEHLRPYVRDEFVIHIGQRDQEEARQYGSQDIRQTPITCISLEDIERLGIEATAEQVLQRARTGPDGYWIHYDTDVLSDAINPAVDYRLPGGLSFEQVEHLISRLLAAGKMMGISIAIFNPKLDKDGTIARNIVESLGRAFA